MIGRLAASTTTLSVSAEKVTDRQPDGSRLPAERRSRRGSRGLVLLVLLLIIAGALVAGFAGVARASQASGCGGTSGYSYAGVGATTVASGISALITPLGSFDFADGHVAGWVGVGGPGEGPNHTDEWLQVGISGFPGKSTDIYYEVAHPKRTPVYHQVSANPPVGRAVKVAVVEIAHRANWWEVFVNGTAASPPIHLAASHHRWAPIATAEGWDGGTGGACNPFLYRSRDVSILTNPGGSWHRLLRAYPIGGGSTKLRRSGSSFLAAEGKAAFQMLASLKP
jgi:hypothetical protein